MVVLAYVAFSESNEYESVLPAAAACELIHQGILMHDDIIDRDDVRYGTNNVSGQYMQTYHELEDSDRRHFANAAAMLGGDVLISESHRLLQQCGADRTTQLKVLDIFSTSVNHVVGGELIDVEAAFTETSTDHSLIVARYKTASYSYVGPLCIGAQLAGVDGKTLALIKRFGEAVGTAFQLKDDLLGTFGDETTTGKSTTTDLLEAKRTYLIEQFELIATTESKNEFHNYFGVHGSTDQEINRAKTILRASGAIEKVEQKIASYKQEALEALDNFNITSSARSQFELLINMSIDRVK